MPTIEINCEETSESIILHFADNGIGIDEKYQDQIFEMFTRLNKRSEYAGSGLGLSIVKKLTNLMEGQISLSKSDSSGTTFSLQIPKLNPGSRKASDATQKEEVLA